MSSHTELEGHVKHKSIPHTSAFASSLKVVCSQSALELCLVLGYLILAGTAHPGAGRGRNHRLRCLQHFSSAFPNLVLVASEPLFKSSRAILSLFDSVLTCNDTIDVPPAILSLQHERSQRLTDQYSWTARSTESSAAESDTWPHQF